MEHLYSFAKMQAKTVQFSLHLLIPRQAFSILGAQSVPKYVKHCPYTKFSEKETNLKTCANGKNLVFPFVPFFWHTLEALGIYIYMYVYIYIPDDPQCYIIPLSTC